MDRTKENTTLNENSEESTSQSEFMPPTIESYEIINLHSFVPEGVKDDILRMPFVKEKGKKPRG